MKECIFCGIVERKIPSSVEQETEKVIAFKSIEPVARVHILIVPKKHIEEFTDIKPQDSEYVMEMVSVTQDLLSRKRIRSGYKLVFNGGKYQSVEHLHWHLLGGSELEDNSELINRT